MSRKTVLFSKKKVNFNIISVKESDGVDHRNIHTHTYIYPHIMYISTRFPFSFQFTSNCLFSGTKGHVYGKKLLLIF